MHTVLSAPRVEMKKGRPACNMEIIVNEEILHMRIMIKMRLWIMWGVGLRLVRFPNPLATGSGLGLQYP